VCGAAKKTAIVQVTTSQKWKKILKEKKSEWVGGRARDLTRKKRKFRVQVQWQRQQL